MPFFQCFSGFGGVKNSLFLEVIGLGKRCEHWITESLDLPYGIVRLEIFKVARLQSEFCTKDFFRATNFLTKNAPKFSPKFLSLCSVGQKNPRKIPSKFPTEFSKFPCEKSKKIHRRASAGAQGEEISCSP